MKLRFRALSTLLVLGLALTSAGCSAQAAAEVVEEESYVPVAVQSADTKTLIETAVFSGKVLSDQEVSVIPKCQEKSLILTSK